MFTNLIYRENPFQNKRGTNSDDELLTDRKDDLKKLKTSDNEKSGSLKQSNIEHSIYNET